jgi:hypothetical protein
MSVLAREPALESLLATTFPGERGPTIAPTLYLALYIDPVDPADVLDFVARARDTLGSRLRCFQTETMKYPAPLDEVKIQRWFERKLAASRRLEMRSLILDELGDDGVSPSRMRIDVDSLRIEPLAEAQRLRADETRHARKIGQVLLTAGALLLVGFPYDGPLAEAGNFISWIGELQAVTGGRLICGSAGIALHLAPQVFGSESVDQHERAKGLLARHPGLDLIPMIGQRVMYVTGEGVVRTRLRRAAWLNLLSNATVEELGGIARVRSALEGTPAHVERLGTHAWLVQASPAPRIGDVSTGDRVPEYVAVGRLLKPVVGDKVSIDVLSYSLEWGERWYRALDGDVPA